MTIKTILFLLLFFPAPGLRADENCGKTSEACKAPAKQISPFMAELRNAGTKTALKPATPVETKLRQGPDPKPGTLRPGAAKTPLNTAAHPGETAPETPAAANKTALSSPAWLIAAAALLAGLYHFLKATKK